MLQFGASDNPARRTVGQGHVREEGLKVCGFMVLLQELV